MQHSSKHVLVVGGGKTTGRCGVGTGSGPVGTGKVGSLGLGALLGGEIES